MSEALFKQTEKREAINEAKNRLRKKGIPVLDERVHMGSRTVEEKMIMDTRGDENSPGLKSWKWIDLLVNHAGFKLMHPKAFHATESKVRRLRMLSM